GFKGSFDLRLAAIVGPACFLWGAAGGHVYQMITTHNFAPGNAGVIFYSDVLVSILGFIFLGLQSSSAAPTHRLRLEQKMQAKTGCMDGQLLLEQIENGGSRPRSRPLAVEKHDGVGESGDVAGAWD